MAQIQDETGNPVLANVSATGAFTLLNDEALVTIFGQAVAAVQIASLVGSITISFEGSVDGTTYQAVTGIRPADGTSGSSTTANGVWVFGIGGYKKFRARVSAVAGGTATATVNAGQGSAEAPFGGAVTVSGAVDTELPAPAALADATANPTVPAVGAFGMVWNGATWDRMQGTVNGVEVQGPVAHDAAAAGNPVPLGAQARTSFLTAVANGDLVALIADKLGRLLVSMGVPRELITQNNITLTTTTETTLIALGGAGVFRDITAIVVSNTSGTAVRVDFRDATAGTVRFSLMIAASGGGGIFTPTRPVKQTTANNNWTAQLSAAVTDVRIFAQTEDNA